MRFPPMVRRTPLGFLLAALVGILVGRFLVPALDFWGVVLGVIAAMAMDVYLRNREWRRQQREAEEDETEPGTDERRETGPGPARRRDEHRPQPPREAHDETGGGRRRRRRRR